MESVLSEEGEDLRRRLRDTATVPVAITTSQSAETGAQANANGVDPSRGNANQWADREKSRVQFGYDADVEAEKWWAEHGQKTIGPLARM